jgi:two-component system, response regulator, stage 0 sporulation protein A
MSNKIREGTEMSEKVKILLVDDNRQLIVSLKDFFSKQGDIEVAGVAENGLIAIEVLKKGGVDLVVLDIIMPQMDGLGVLDWLMSQGDSQTPDVVVITAMGHEEIIRRTSEMGARYFMMKPIAPEQLQKRILEIRGLRVLKKTVINATQLKGISMNEEITNIFLTVGIPAHIKGYHFLREAVKMVVENNELINCITKQLYPGIAIRFSTTPSKVERAIRHAIEVAWTRGRIENINSIFGFNIYNKNDKPTNGEFIALLADKILIERSKTA